MNNEILGAGLFALAAALIAIAYSYWQYRSQLIRSQNEAIADAKKRIIEDLVSYRFVLLDRYRNHPESRMKFNAALSAIPVHFSHSKPCLDAYRSIGDNFTAEKYYNLIITMMKDVPLGVHAIDKQLLENVPSVAPIEES